MASKIIVKEHGLSSNILRRLTRFPRRMERDMVVTECIIGRNETSDNVDVFLRSEIYKIDHELDARFSGEKLLHALQALTADIASFFKGKNYYSSGMQLR